MQSDNSGNYKLIESYLKNFAIVPTVKFSSVLLPNVKISVIIPSYCEQNYIGNTLLSLNKQRYKDFEVICVDNNSSDGTIKVIQNLRKKLNYPLSLLVEKTPGPGMARKTGADFVVRRLKNKLNEDLDDYYIANTDADCCPPDDWLQKIVTVFQNKSYGMCGGPHTGCEKIDREIETKLGIVNYFKTVADVNNFIATSKIGRLKFSGPNNSIRVNAYIESGGMRQPLKIDGSIALKEIRDLSSRVESSGYFLGYLPSYMVSSRRRHLMQLLNDQDMYFPKKGKIKHFIVINEEEDALLHAALKKVPKRKWLIYQDFLIGKIIDNTIINPILYGNLSKEKLRDFLADKNINFTNISMLKTTLISDIKNLVKKEAKA